MTRLISDAPVSMDLIFLTGWGFHRGIWSAWMERYPDALFLDITDCSAPNIDGMTDVLNQRCKGPVQLVGWSLGGLMAIRFADRFPEKVTRLVLVGVTPKFIATPGWVGMSATQFQQLMSMAEQQGDRLLSRRFLQWVNYPNTHQDIRQYLKEALWTISHHQGHAMTMLHLLATIDMREAYQRLKMPVTHVLGAEDAVTSVEGAALTALNPSIQLSIIPGAGHALFITHQAIFQKYL